MSARGVTLFLIDNEEVLDSLGRVGRFIDSFGNRYAQAIAVQRCLLKR